MTTRVTTLITRVTTLWRVHVTSLSKSVTTTRFLHELLLILNAIRSHLKVSNDKQILTLVVVSSEIYETGRRLVS